jgi:hypothetical protein
MLTGTTTYELGILTEVGTNDGTVVATRDKMLGWEAGMMTVPWVETVFPGEISYKVVVSMTTVTNPVSTEAGKTVESLGISTWVGTDETVMVPITTEAGTVITAELGTSVITLNGTLLGTFE